MEQEKLERILDLHKKWIMGSSNGKQADLTGANLTGANLAGAILKGVDLKWAVLKGADLRGANLDFACWPLWCGSLGVKVCARIAAQIAYHFCRLNCSDPAYLEARDAIIPFANKFHRVEECGRIEKAPKKLEAPLGAKQ